MSKKKKGHDILMNFSNINTITDLIKNLDKFKQTSLETIFYWAYIKAEAKESPIDFRDLRYQRVGQFVCNQDTTTSQGRRFLQEEYNDIINDNYFSHTLERNIKWEEIKSYIRTFNVD